MRIHRDADMSIHKATHMRIHNDANMSFHKDRQSPLIEATRAGRISLPGQPPSAVTKCPLPAPAAGAPCTTSQSPPFPGSAPRARAAGPTPPCCAHRVAAMRVTPAHRLPRPPPPDPAAQPRSGRLPTATPANHPDGQHRTRCSRRHRRRQPAGRYLLPGDASASNGDGLSPTGQRRRRLLARSRRRRRCRRCLWCRRRGGYSSAVATPGRRRRC
jgi:hypothetical protein